MGGNAVVGYLQCFDLEGESGLVVRAIGTACTLDKLSSGSAPNTNTHMHPNTAPASNACNSPSKDGKEWVWTNNTSMHTTTSFMCKTVSFGKDDCVCTRGRVCGLKRVLYKSLCAHSCVCLSISWFPFALGVSIVSRVVHHKTNSTRHNLRHTHVQYTHSHPQPPPPPLSVSALLDSSCMAFCSASACSSAASF